MAIATGGSSIPSSVADIRRTWWPPITTGRIDDLDWVKPGDLEKIASPIDFVGINYYTSLIVEAGREESEDTGVDPGADPPMGSQRWVGR